MRRLYPDTFPEAAKMYKWHIDNRESEIDGKSLMNASIYVVRYASQTLSRPLAF